MPNFISEDQIERALVQKLQHLHGFDLLDCYTENLEDLHDGSGRTNKRDGILTDRVKEAATRLNPDIPAKTIDDTLLSQDEWREGFAIYENTITSLYEACKPEILGSPVVRTVAVFQYLRGVVDAIVEQKDIDAVGVRISQLLDESVVVDRAKRVHEREEEWHITRSGKTWDLSKINFDKLKEDFRHASYKNIEIADLRAFIQRKLEQMLQQNATRSDFAQRLQGIIDAYNAGSSSADHYFEELLKFTQDL